MWGSKNSVIINKLVRADLLILIFFIIIYLCSLTFHYVEGDDASTIVYHAMGRNKDLQRPYEAYHSGFDFILSALPANEPILRISAIGISAISETIVVVLMMNLALLWLKVDKKSKYGVFVTIITLLAIPELFFAGLYINPSAIAMAFIMVSHFLVRRYFSPKSKWWLLIIAAILFGFGSTIRWNTILYGLIIATDILWLSGIFNFKKAIAVILWGIASLLFFFGFLYIQGYSIHTILDVLNYKNQVIEINDKISPLLDYIQSSTFYTPIMLLLTIAGLFYLIVIDKKLFLFSILSLVFMWLLFRSLFFKILITIFPVLFTLVIAGINGIEAATCVIIPHNKAKNSKIAIFVACAFLWIFGLKIGNSKIWGPGFELKEKYFSYKNESLPVLKEKYNYSLGFMDGCGYPSPEGPRPMGGYAGILLCDKWRTFIKSEKTEYNSMVDSSLQKGYPFIKLEYTYYIENILAERGFKTKDSYKKKLTNSVGKRSYYNDKPDSVIIYHLSLIGIRDTNLLNRIIDDSRKNTFIIYGGHYGIPKTLKNQISSNNLNSF